MDRNEKHTLVFVRQDVNMQAISQYILGLFTQQLHFCQIVVRETLSAFCLLLDKA